LTFYDFPAEHWLHIRTTNPIESTFATVRLRTTKTRGCVSRAGLLAMVFKLTKTAEQNWRTLKGHALLGPGDRRRALQRRFTRGSSKNRRLMDLSYTTFAKNSLKLSLTFATHLVHPGRRLGFKHASNDFRLRRFITVDSREIATVISFGPT